MSSNDHRGLSNSGAVAVAIQTRSIGRRSLTCSRGNLHLPTANQHSLLPMMLLRSIFKSLIPLRHLLCSPFVIIHFIRLFYILNSTSNDRSIARLLDQ